MMKHPLVLFAILIALALNACRQIPIKKEKPNILFILADDLGYYDLSCMGSDYYETPISTGLQRKG
jgi:hypothetical protein